MKKTCFALIPVIAALCFIPTVAEATALSDLTAATAGNTLANGNNVQDWHWDTLTGGGPGLKLESSSTGAPTSGQDLLEVLSTGANSTSGAVTRNGYFATSRTGTNSTDYGVYAEAGGGSHNYAIYGNTNQTNAGDLGVWGDARGASGATYGIYGTNASATGYAGYFNNSNGGYAAAFMGGNVGIGTATPSTLLHAYGGVITDTQTALGTTSTDGLVLTNTTAAANNAQQYSPRLHFTGQALENQRDRRKPDRRFHPRIAARSRHSQPIRQPCLEQSGQWRWL